MFYVCFVLFGVVYMKCRKSMKSALFTFGKVRSEFKKYIVLRVHTVCFIDYICCRAVANETIIAIANVNPVRLHRKETFLGKFLVHCDCEKRLKTIIIESMRSAADFAFPRFAEQGYSWQIIVSRSAAQLGIRKHFWVIRILR